jgi:hypothetical protein
MRRRLTARRDPDFNEGGRQKLERLSQYVQTPA